MVGHMCFTIHGLDYGILPNLICDYGCGGIKYFSPLCYKVDFSMLILKCVN